MNKEDTLNYFQQCMEENADISSAVAAIHTLIEHLKLSPAGTLAGLRESLKDCISWLMETDNSVTSISSGCELFLRFITLTALDQMSILTHSHSRVVLKTLLEAAANKKRFNIYITESCPDRSGEKMARKLREAGIPVVVILDAAAGYIMEKVDLVMVGAEGVVESGGIINKIGTYQLATCAKIANKPFYVVVESFKFVRFIYPLNQQDVPNEYKYHASTLKSFSDLSHAHPLIDYTPPTYITLLFTDLGVLTPSAISDELIKLYC
ncbi:translation initiation factor eIF-2B subunit alpha-like isoform X2 [Patiria miniata]|uniref:Translation initiation factor eIF2B subunit alpha n=1 Tax=Patiria miniata TaxID=46514 RepID=A0A914AD34_PATMI|nr:translation initiation factor eIF-2B subunit alpha-like isoform X2 [Patiria miniata]